MADRAMKDIKGRIHSFESFGTLDGPGIRFVVFMQGCALRCVYCHNRDTWNVWGGKQYTVDEVMAELMKYYSFIEASGGGITVTGGEPTIQALFVEELFQRCKKNGIHTALDTSGYTPVGRVKGLLAKTDLVLLDLKHADDKKHREITGGSNEMVRKFAEYVSDSGIDMWIRYVLVPGLTDGEEDLKVASEFIKGLATVKKVEVLPYHTMGEYKWKQMDRDYKLEGVKPPNQQQLERAKEILTC